MKRKIRRKFIKAVCFILAAVSLPVTICASIIFGICMDRGFTVTDSLKLESEDGSIYEAELEHIVSNKRTEVLERVYNSFIYGCDPLENYKEYEYDTYDALETYNDYMERYSKENSNYYFYIKPSDDKFPELSNYYEGEYQYKNTGTYSKRYYENLMYTYPYSRDKIAEEWLNNYSAENSGAMNISRNDVIREMEVEVFFDNTLDVTFNGYTYCIDLSSESDFIEKQREFELGNTADWKQLRGVSVGYDAGSQQIIYEYIVTYNIDLEYTEYVRKELTAHDDFYYSPILKYGDIISNYTVPVLIGGSIALIILSVLICVLAGRKPGREDVVCGKAEKIPLEIFIFIYAAAAALLFVMLEMAEIAGIHILGVIGAVILAAAMSFLYPVFLHTIAVRIKAKIILKNTLIYKIFKCLKRCVSFLWRNIHIYGKFLGIYAAICIVKTFVAINLDWYMWYVSPQTWIIIWLADIIVAVFLVIALINMNRLKKGAVEIAKGNTEYKIDTSHMLSEYRQHGETLNNIGDGIQAAVEERIKSERMKTELITNVSHDIKTPITSIISYVDLLGKENIENEKASEYIEVLKRQSERLKKLVQDLIDASKAATGNMPVNIEQVNINVMLEQIIGESMEKLMSRNIKPIVKYGNESAIASADGRLLYRSLDNLIQNIYKYAMENSRVYIDVEESHSHISVQLKNISGNELNVSGDELMERFVRGDSSRNTEGSGLGLSIAKSLLEIQGGSLKVVIDGDLFKAVVMVKKYAGD